MIRTGTFFTTTLAYLLFLDCQLVFMRIFYRSNLENHLNWAAPHWANRIINLAKLFLGLRYRNETTQAMRDQLPPQFLSVCNHQSFLDIVFAYDTFTSHQVRFVAKKSLGKNFPGVAQTLRYQGHALIEQSGSARGNFDLMTKFAKRCSRRGFCPIIFPEGTRSRTGELGIFQPAGLRMILDSCSLPIVVTAMDGGWKMATIKDYFNKEPKRVRVKVLGVLPAPKNKEETRLVLANSREMIAAQLDIWRSEDHN